MFTGLIQDVGVIKNIQVINDGLRIGVATSFAMQEVDIGASICVSGVCLTVIEKSTTSFTADVSPETISKTTLQKLQLNDKVNLEQSLTLATKLGGHLVSGHVDTTTKILNIISKSQATDYIFALSSPIAKYVAVKGSIGIDGVSLTVNTVATDSFMVSIIPHTARNTVFQDYAVGNSVNIEIDTVARYVERMMAVSITEEAFFS